MSVFQIDVWDERKKQLLSFSVEWEPLKEPLTDLFQRVCSGVYNAIEKANLSEPGKLFDS